MWTLLKAPITRSLYCYLSYKCACSGISPQSSTQLSHHRDKPNPTGCSHGLYQRYNMSRSSSVEQKEHWIHRELGWLGSSLAPPLTDYGLWACWPPGVWPLHLEVKDKSVCLPTLPGEVVKIELNVMSVKTLWKFWALNKCQEFITQTHSRSPARFKIQEPRKWHLVTDHCAMGLKATRSHLKEDPTDQDGLTWVSMRVLLSWFKIYQACLNPWILFFFLVLGFELRAYNFSHSTSPFFCDGFFWDKVSQTICPGCLWTSILLISASWVARITGVSH
jgi:hypothetical protein